MVNNTKQNKSTEELILEAAEKEFLQYGYAAAKTVRIAATANVTHAMLHYYFRTKENLFNKVFTEKMQLIAKAILPYTENKNLPLLERLRIVIENHFDFISDNPQLPRFIANELISKPDKLAKLEGQIKSVSSSVISLLQKDIDYAAEKGEIKKIGVIDLILDIVSINVFPFIVQPILNIVIGNDKNLMRSLLEKRKEENVQIIMSRLKPDNI